MENVKLIKASGDQKIVIKNLMQLYMYDFSEFIDIDVGPEGLFPSYNKLDQYSTDEIYSFPYLIIHKEKYAGFVLVRLIEMADRSFFSIAEFFVLKKYRRSGLGKKMAIEMFNLHKGNWEVFQKESNIPAQHFWRKVIDIYTHGNYSERFEDGKYIQQFNSES